MHHERGCPGSLRCLGQRARVANAAADAAQQWRAATELLGDGMHHGFGFPGRETVELAGIAIGHENVHARAYGAINDRL